jgi:osmotically-inducible protein OsmY
MFNFQPKEDTQLQKDVMNELMWDQGVSSNQISVTADDGIITLRGNVPHYSEKATAEQATQRVSGVRAVADEIEVKIMGSYERTDDDIAEAALNAIDWNYSAPVGLKVLVDNGWITLNGEAEWDYERKAASDAVSQLMGVRGVSNKITLKSSALPSDIKARIEEAIERSSIESEKKNIHVHVKGDRVVLTGKVFTFADIENAGLAAWNAPGVSSVENNLKFEN